jgi:VanZ family protein
VRIALFAACLGVIAYLSLAPGDRLPAIESLWDKAEHALAHAGLTFAGLALSSRRRSLVAGIWLFGVGIEALQAIMPFDRQGDWRDVVANSVGIGAALAALGVWRSIRARQILA